MENIEFEEKMLSSSRLDEIKVKVEQSEGVN